MPRQGADLWGNVQISSNFADVCGSEGAEAVPTNAQRGEASNERGGMSVVKTSPEANEGLFASFRPLSTNFASEPNDNRSCLPVLPKQIIPLCARRPDASPSSQSLDINSRLNSMAQAVLASALQGVKLRKATIEKDASAPLFEGTLEREGLHEYHNTILDTNMEVWYDALGPEITFETKFFEITVETAELLRSCYETRVLQKQALSDAQTASLQMLESGLQKVIDEVRGEDEFVFVKTSCRSPKDTVIFASSFKEKYQAALKNSGSRSENSKLVSLLEAAIDLLKTRNACEMLQVFTSSERIYQDMTVATSNPERFEQHFAVRKWVTVPPSLEFRGFYHAGKLNALAQYNHSCFYDVVHNNTDKLVKMIRKYFEEKVQPRLVGANIAQCIVDFAVTDIEKEEIWVIELNPFVYTTDAGLFSWMHERKILENGPFEFRHVDRPRTGALVSIADEWKKMVEDEEAEFAAQKH